MRRSLPAIADCRKQNFTEQNDTSNNTRKAVQRHRKPLHGVFVFEPKVNTERKTMP